MISRREWLRRSAAAGAAVLIAQRLEAGEAPKIAITVYKSPSCGCCTKWVQHLEANGFKIATRDVEDVDPIKKTMGVPAALASCHTGLVGKYVVEGHVPADVIKRLLKEKPAVLGLAVPGMPSGSPGMEGGPKERYDILTFDRAGKTKVYATR